jgi:hypothetical protein
VQVTQDPAAVFAIVGLIGIVAVIALISGSGILSRVPPPPRPSPPPPDPQPREPQDLPTYAEELEHQPKAPADPPPEPPAPTTPPRAVPKSNSTSRAPTWVIAAAIALAMVVARYVFSRRPQT